MAKQHLETLQCFHCGNTTQFAQKFSEETTQLYEVIDNREYYEDFVYLCFQCLTCNGITLLGGFKHELPKLISEYPRLYPHGPALLPPIHMLAGGNPIPENILDSYEEIWPLRHIAPNAFIGQTRRALEIICNDQEAPGDTLFQMLENLVEQGNFPGYFQDISHLIRKVGNMGVHASDRKLTIWDAELIDELFRAIVEYVYIAPAKIERLKQRTEQKNTQEN